MYNLSALTGVVIDLDKLVTHLLAIGFSIALMGLVIYTVVVVTDKDVAVGAMGFSAGLLGTILGYYFNRERLSAETREKERIASERDDFDAQQAEIRRRYASTLAALDSLQEDE